MCTWFTEGALTGNKNLCAQDTPLRVQMQSPDTDVYILYQAEGGAESSCQGDVSAGGNNGLRNGKALVQMNSRDLEMAITCPHKAAGCRGIMGS